MKSFEVIFWNWTYVAKCVNKSSNDDTRRVWRSTAGEFAPRPQIALCLHPRRPTSISRARALVTRANNVPLRTSKFMRVRARELRAADVSAASSLRFSSLISPDLSSPPPSAAITSPLFFYPFLNQRSREILVKLCMKFFKKSVASENQFSNCFSYNYFGN